MEKFSFDTISDFDNHISSSILGYDLLDSLILNIADFFISDGIVYDLGCTSGRLVQKISEEYSANCVGYDITDANFIPNAKANLVVKDITNIDRLPNADLVTSVFTLQFIPYRHRKGILEKIFESLTPTGAFIFCEKERSYFDHKFEFANYQNKLKGFSASEILSKEKKLRTVMHPLYPKQNQELLHSTGFNYEVFFKSLNYTGYICTK